MGIKTIAGRVTVKAAAGVAVAGLEVVAISTTQDGSTIELGRAVTNEDGHFEISAADSPGSKLTLTVRNARHVEIKVVTPKIRPDELPIKIIIPLEAAQEHGRYVTLPASPDDPFIPLPHMLDTIIRAVELIAPQGTLHHDRYLEAARCPIPPRQLAEEMYSDALDVLRGNPFAASRFVELVELVNTDLAAVESHALVNESGMNDHVHAQWVPSDAPCLPPEKTIPIFAAAAMIANSGMYSIDRIANSVLRLLCHFEDFGFVHRLAVEATVSTQAQRRFAAVLDWRLPECGPMPGPGEPGIPWPEKRKCLPWLDWHRECFNATLEAAPRVAYKITQVNPHVACPGDLLSIKGTNFGSSGIVVFRRLGGGELDVIAQSWTDTLITVVVPPTAAGGLWLRIPAGTEVVCGVVVETSVVGQVYQAFIGSPYIEALHLGGNPMPPFVVRPGAPITVHWRVYGVNTVRVTVSDENGTPILTRPLAPSNGYLATLNAPTVSSPRLWRAKVVASGHCPPGLVERSINIWISEDPSLAIDGIEVTQAIQYYKSSLHLTDTADQQADNSVTLVRNKAAWVRVYLKSWSPPNFNGVNWTGVRGTLRVERIDNGQVTWSTTLNSQNAMVTVTVGATYAAVRGDISRTLNFVIPAAEAHGRLQLTAECKLTSIPFGGSIAPRSVMVDFALDQRLRIAGIMVAYDGPPMIDSPPGTPNLVLAAPTIADLDATLPLTLSTYPVGADFETRDAGRLTLVVPLSDPPTATGCSDNWSRLLDELALARIADGNRAGWTYYGLLPNGVPIHSIFGCGGGSGATSFDGHQVALAHELGHVFGRLHSPCGAVGVSDDTYPAYEPYDTAMNRKARIGEYGLDIRTGTIHLPTENDFMSFCAPRWVSLHTYTAFINLSNLNPQTVGANAGAPLLREAESPQRFDMINVVGRVDEDGNYKVRSVARAQVQLGAVGATQTKVQLELLDAEGRKLAYGWIFASVPQAEGSGPCNCGQSVRCGELLSPPYFLEARLPYRDDGVVLRIREAEKVLWERRAFPARPNLKIELCRVTKHRQLQLRWSSTFDPDSTPEFWVQWAPGRSEDWRGLAVGLRNNEVTLRATALPGGKHRIRVSLHDGFTSAFATSDVQVPEQRPTVSILHPNEGDELDGSQGLLLWGRGVESDGRLVGDEKLEWRLNKRKVGTGGELRLSTFDLEYGEMEVELIATSTSGRSARKVSFRLLGTRQVTVDS